VTFGTYRELLARSRSFDALAVMRVWQPTMTGGAEPERLDGQRVTASYFKALGVTPALGRDFEPSDDVLNGPKMLIISDGLWQRVFGGDRAIIGRQIPLGDNSFTVVGVMPPGFDNVLAPAAQVWTALQYDMSMDQAWGHHLRMIGRVKPHVSIAQAKRELDLIAKRPIADFPRPPWATFDRGLIVTSLQDDVTQGVKPALLAVLGAVSLLLVIACVNVTNLLLARGSQRRGEFAVRTALGATRGRLIAQLITEGLLLAAVGGALGMLVAQLGVRGLIALSPPGLPRVNAIVLDSSVFLFGLAITTLTGLAFGLVPALHVSNTGLHGDLQQSSRRTAGGHQLTRRLLVVAEVAIALVLLVGSGLLMRSLQRLFAVTPGFESANVLTLQVQTSGRRFTDDTTLHRYFAQTLAAVRQVPGVEAADVTSQLPLSGDADEYGVHFESTGQGREAAGYSIFRYGVSPSYHATMGIPLRRGRLLDDRDVAGAPGALLISESVAKRRFPGQDAIGQRARVGPNDGPWFTIVGIVADVKQTSLALGATDAVYLTTSQWRFPDNALSFVIRTRDDPTALTGRIKKAIWSVDKDQPIVRIATMDALLARSAAERRFALILFEAFGIVALILAATGIYAVLSGSVTERMREIGVRSALGASRANILALILRQGMTLTGVGVIVGVSAAVAASRALVTLLFGITQLDPVTYVGVVVLLIVVSGIACWLPASRASRVDPSITLRAE
jgi:putative ABC transport system permease protein